MKILFKYFVFSYIISISSIAYGQCSCKDFLYVNDEDFGLVHKFEVNPSDGSLTEVGSPWFDGSIIAPDLSPHGIAADLNGFLYIGQRFVGDNPIMQLNCAGELIDAEAIPDLPHRASNLGSRDHYLYVTNVEDDEIVAYDFCNGERVGAVTVTEQDINEIFWGYFQDATNWYVPERTTNCIYTGSLDISNFTDPPSTNGTSIFCIDANITDDPMGMTMDEQGNLYIVVEQNNQGSSNGIKIQKYDGSGNLLSEVVNDGNQGANLADGQAGFWGARGIVYSESSGYIYVASKENCITVFDNDLNQLSTLNIGNPNDGSPKGIGILTECCPTPSTIVIDTVLCDAGPYPIDIFLQDFLPCSGIICEGMWTPDASNVGIDYDDCDNSLVLNEQSCGTFTLFSDGSDALSQCGQFSVTLNIEVAITPSISTTGQQSICEGDVPSILTATSTDTGIYYQWQMSTISCTDGFSDIVGATSNTYAPPSISNTTYYRVIANTAGDCATGTCETTSDCITVTVETCSFPSLRLSKTADVAMVNLGQPVTFTLIVYNDGTEELTNIEVTDVLPTDLTYTSDNSGGSYNNGTGIWSIPSISIGDSTVIQIMATTDAEGIIFNEAEITAADQLSNDPDTTDNIDNACVSVPVQVCDNEPINVDLIAQSGFTSYQWYKDGILITGATAATYTATDTGTYTYTVDGAGPTGDCEGELCCPVIIEQISCCTPIQCLPIIITKMN